jgi:hypothetical protein
MCLITIPGGGGVYNRLNAPNPTIGEHNLDAVGVGGAFGQQAENNAFRLNSVALILFFHDLNAKTGFDFDSFW